MKYRRIFVDGYSYYLTMETHWRNPLLVKYPKIISDIKINPVKHGYVEDVKDWHKE